MTEHARPTSHVPERTLTSALQRTAVRPAVIAAVVAATLAMGACRGTENAPAAADSAATRSDTAAAMPGTARMDHGDMPGMQDGGMMDQMQAHMRMMDGASADSMRAMMPTHRQMVANMLAQLNREMRDMNMQSDAAWTATVDSLRRDLVRLPELSGGELQSFMPEHRGRVMRLVEMHRSMMRRMQT